MRKNYWSAITKEGAMFLVNKKLSRVQTAIVLYFIANVDEENTIAMPKASEILENMNKQAEITFHKGNFYNAFSKLLEVNIIARTDINPDLKNGFMLNPFISYQGGKPSLKANIENYLICINAHWIDEYLPEKGYTDNEIPLEPFDKRIVSIF